jgi:hypothetical protein
VADHILRRIIIRTGERAGIPTQGARGGHTTEIRIGLKHVECESTGIHRLKTD